MVKCEHCNKVVYTVYIRKNRIFKALIINDKKVFYCKNHVGFVTREVKKEVS